MARRGVELSASGCVWRGQEALAEEVFMDSGASGHGIHFGSARCTDHASKGPAQAVVTLTHLAIIGQLYPANHYSPRLLLAPTFTYHGCRRLLALHLCSPCRPQDSGRICGWATTRRTKSHIINLRWNHGSHFYELRWKREPQFLKARCPSVLIAEPLAGLIANPLADC